VVIRDDAHGLATVLAGASNIRAQSNGIIDLQRLETSRVDKVLTTQFAKSTNHKEPETSSLTFPTSIDIAPWLTAGSAFREQE
jgi:hypothetical protein